MVKPANRSASAGAIQKDASGRKHLPELDALRGAAAFVVLMNHCHQVWLGTSHPHWISRPKLNPALWLLVNGHASVILFFLLSGFVLTLPSLQGSNQRYPQYVVRRICRIYLPYLAGLVVAVIGCTYFWGRTEYGEAVAELWALPPDRTSILQHLAVIGRFDVYRYDVPFWSLVHEMRISLIFPAVLWVAKRMRLGMTFVVAAACTLVSTLSLKYLETGMPGSVRVTAWSFTLSYCGTFLLGAALARRHERYAKLLAGLSLAKKAALLAAALVLYLYPPPAVDGIDLGDFVSSCGGVVLLTFCLHHSGYAARWLRRAPWQFLGRISYSLYLVHYPILLALAHTFYGRFALPWLMLPFLVLALGVATAMYALVEAPSITLGRKASASI